MSDFDDIDRFADEYIPEHSGFLPGPEVLTDGVYDLEITSAELAKTSKKQETIFKLNLKVVSGPMQGLELQRPTFFNKPEDLNYLGGDLVTLGLNAKNWGKQGKPWSQELLDACPTLKGMRFRGNKATSKGKSQDFHKIYILSRLHSTPAAPPPPRNDFSPPPATAALASSGYGDIPF